MRKKKYIFIVVFSLVIVWVSGYGIYWYHKLDGMNVPIIISTQYSSRPTKIEVYIDNELVFKSDSLQTLYISTEAHVACGYHQLKTIVDTKEFIEFFLVFPIRWIYIEVQKDSSLYKKENDVVIIDFSFSPIGLM